MRAWVAACLSLLCVGALACHSAILPHSVVAKHGVFVTVQADSNAPRILVDRDKADFNNVPIDEARYERYFCGDGFGFLGVSRPEVGGTAYSCEFCDLRGMERDADLLWHHAERLWNITNRAPFDADSTLAGCVRTVWQRGLLLRPDNRALRLALTRFQIASSEPLERALAWRAWDLLTDSLIRKGDNAGAANIVADAGLAMLDRAEVLLQRPEPVTFPLLPAEAAVRQLALGAPALRQLPALPAEPSERLGLSEVQHALRLFQRAIELAPDDIRIRKLALEAAMWHDDAHTLDALATTLLKRNPRDSIAWPAHALSRLFLEGFTSGTGATFDTLLTLLPRVDSARYDGLDEVVSSTDADWQLGFLPDQRATLERRTWSVLDPMWITPVNEIRLATMARAAIADLRYARGAAPGLAGSETPVGLVLRRRGLPDARWRYVPKVNAPATCSVLGDVNRCVQASRTFQRGMAVRLERGWPTFRTSLDVNWDRGPLGDVRLAFYGSELSLAKVAVRGTTVNSCPWSVGVQSALNCARGEQAQWPEVPYHNDKDTVDVELTRFRGRTVDSAEFYMAARIPVRWFRERGAAKPDADPDVRIAAWIKTPTGELIAHDEKKRSLRGNRVPAWAEQWHFTALSQSYMHRVEAMNASTGASAWGRAVRPSREAAVFATTGFGISDPLVARTIVEPAGGARRWRDLTIEPSAGVVAPKGVLAVAWEIYDLKPNANGRCQWSVEVSLKGASDIKHPGFQDLIVGSSVDTRALADSVKPEYRVVRNGAPAPVIVDRMNVGVNNADSGVYLLQLKVTDLTTGKVAITHVNVRVLDDKVQDRQPAPALDPRRMMTVRGTDP